MEGGDGDDTAMVDGVAVDVAAAASASVLGTAVHCLPFSVVRKAPSGRFWSDMLAKL